MNLVAFLRVHMRAMRAGVARGSLARATRKPAGLSPKTVEVRGNLLPPRVPLPESPGSRKAKWDTRLGDKGSAIRSMRCHCCRAQHQDANNILQDGHGCVLAPRGSAHFRSLSRAAGGGGHRLSEKGRYERIYKETARNPFGDLRQSAQWGSSRLDIRYWILDPEELGRTLHTYSECVILLIIQNFLEIQIPRRAGPGVDCF